MNSIELSKDLSRPNNIVKNSPWINDYICAKVMTRKRLFSVVKAQPNNIRLKNLQQVQVYNIS